MTLRPRCAAPLIYALVAGCGSSPAPVADAGADPDGGGVDGSTDTTSGPCGVPHTREVLVTTAAQLSSALSAAAPGDLIHLADGTYAGHFTLAASGASGSPIVLCGTRAAVLDGGGTTSGYVLHVTGSHVVLSGFTARNAQKGIVLDGASHCTLQDLEVTHLGMEGVHFRAFSTHNVLQRSYVHDTGVADARYGEGVYIGSAQSNWASLSGGQADRSDDNDVLDCRIEHTASECIDIKEGSTGGRIAGNTFDGTAISGQNSADSWVDVKGNGYLLENNSGTNTGTVMKDGYQVHVILTGWGNDNTFRHNTSVVNGAGHAIWVQSTATGNVVQCDNTQTGAASGLTNVTCQ